MHSRVNFPGVSAVYGIISPTFLFSEGHFFVFISARVIFTRVLGRFLLFRDKISDLVVFLSGFFVFFEKIGLFR